MSLYVSLVILFALNTIMVFSTSPQSVVKQLLAWIVGLAWFYWGRSLSFKIDPKTKILIFTLTCLILLIPLLFGENIRGSRRWLNIGPASLQPAELVKPWLTLFVANSSLPELILIPSLLIALQPDLSSAISVLLLAVPIYFFDKRRFKIALFLGFIMLLLSPIIWKFGVKDYQKDRISSFMDPTKDATGKGYNIIQSQIAIGSGGFFGKGFKQGTQSQLKFLPERHTDFIFASLAEELGVAGIALLLVAYYLLLINLLGKLKQSSSQTETIFISSTIFYLWSQIIANLGMNLGILPVSGLPLPFISVGGSAILAQLLTLGIIYNKK